MWRHCNDNLDTLRLLQTKSPLHPFNHWMVNSYDGWYDGRILFVFNPEIKDIPPWTVLYDKWLLHHDGLLSIVLLGTYLSEIWIRIISFSLKKMQLKMSSAKMVSILSRVRWVNIQLSIDRIAWHHWSFVDGLIRMMIFLVVSLMLLCWSWWLWHIWHNYEVLTNMGASTY